MKLRVIDNLKFLRLIEATELEFEQLQHSLKKRVRGHFYHPLVKKGIWDGYIPFYKDGFIPVGLWNDVIKLGETFNFSVEIEGLEKIIDTQFNKEDFLKWASEHFADHPKFKPRDYQLDSAISILKYRLTTSEIATSSGKTLIAFLVYGYLKYKGLIDKMLVIVPNIVLVTQLKEDWEEYNNGKLPLHIRMVFGGVRDNDPKANVIVGTFLSLAKKTIDYYKGVNVVCVDECHQAKTTSVRNVIDKCKDATYRFGLSGTVLPDDSADYTTITAYLGPVINTITPKFLFDKGYATPVIVKIVRFDHQNPEVRKQLYEIRLKKDIEGSQILNLEKNLVVQNIARIRFIVDLLSKTTKNSLVLFSNIKDHYGKRLYDTLREKTNEKICYYVDGGVSKEHREYYKSQMELGNDKVLFASFGTFSTGISIKNIHTILLVESYRSEIIIKQSIGRGMRLLEGKDFVLIMDFVDDFSWPNGQKFKKDNYLLRHGNARYEFYKQYTNKISMFTVKI